MNTQSKFAFVAFDGDLSALSETNDFFTAFRREKQLTKKSTVAVLLQTVRF